MNGMKKWIVILIVGYLVYHGIKTLNQKADEELFGKYYDSNFATYEEDVIQESDFISEIKNTIMSWFKEKPKSDEGFIER